MSKRYKLHIVKMFLGLKDEDMLASIFALEVTIHCGIIMHLIVSLSGLHRAQSNTSSTNSW